MATVQKRTWLSRGPTGFSAEWTREAAQDALDARRLEPDAPPCPPAPPPPKTFAEVAEEYLAFKRGKGKSSIHEGEKILTKLKVRLGAATPCPRSRRSASPSMTATA